MKYLWFAVGAALVGGELVAFQWGNVPKAPVLASVDSARSMCLTMATELQRSSSNWAIAGWQLGVLAALLGAVGGLVGSGRDGETRWYRLGAGALIATLGTSLSATAAVSIARSNAASAAAGAATLALKSDATSEVYDRCVEAKAGWLESRVESLDQLPPPGKRGGQPLSVTPVGSNAAP